MITLPSAIGFVQGPLGPFPPIVTWGAATNFRSDSRYLLSGRAGYSLAANAALVAQMIARMQVTPMAPAFSLSLIVQLYPAGVTVWTNFANMAVNEQIAYFMPTLGLPAAGALAATLTSPSQGKATLPGTGAVTVSELLASPATAFFNVTPALIATRLLDAMAGQSGGAGTGAFAADSSIAYYLVQQPPLAAVGGLNTPAMLPIWVAANAALNGGGSWSLDATVAGVKVFLAAAAALTVKEGIRMPVSAAASISAMAAPQEVQRQGGSSGGQAAAALAVNATQPLFVKGFLPPNFALNSLMMGANLATETIPNVIITDPDNIITLQAAGVYNGIPYVDVRFNGTVGSGGTGWAELIFSNQFLATIPGDNWTASCYATVIAGGFTTAISGGPSIAEYGAAAAANLLANLTTGATVGSGALDTQRYSYSAAMAAAVALIPTVTVVGTGGSHYTQAIPIGSALVAAVWYSATSAAATLTDGAGNVFTLAVDSGSQSSTGSAIYHCFSTTAAITTSTNVPVGNGGGNTNGVIMLGGGASYALDKTNAAKAASGTSAAVATGVLANANEVVFAVIDTASGSGTISASGGWSAAGTSTGDKSFYQVVGSTASVTFNATWSSSVRYEAAVATYYISSPNRTNFTHGSFLVNYSKLSQAFDVTVRIGGFQLEFGPTMNALAQTPQIAMVADSTRVKLSTPLAATLAAAAGLGGRSGVLMIAQEALSPSASLGAAVYNPSDIAMGDIVGGTRLGNFSATSGRSGSPFTGQLDIQTGDAATRSGTSGYCGLTLQEPKSIWQVYFRGSSNSGFTSSGSPTITATLYAKTGAAPASGTDGTILGTVSFTDDTAYHTILSNDFTTQWAYVWLYLSTASSVTWEFGYLEFSEALPSGLSSYATLDPTKQYHGDASDNGAISYDDGYLSNYMYDSTFHGGACLANAGKSSGKWYWEVVIDTLYRWIDIGVAANTITLASADGLENSPVGWCWDMGVTGNVYSCSKMHNGSSNSYGSNPHEGDIIGVALDMNIGAIWFSKNGTWQNSATAAEIAAGTTTHACYTGLAGNTLYPAFAFGSDNGTDHRIFVRFDPAAFSYTPPAGFNPVTV